MLKYCVSIGKVLYLSTNTDVKVYRIQCTNYSELNILFTKKYYMTESTLNQRLESFLSSKKISRSDLSRKWHVSKQAVSNWLNDHGQIPLKHIVTLTSEFPELNLRWLFVGSGEMESEVVKVENQDSALARKDGMIELLSQQLDAKDKRISELTIEIARLELTQAMEKSGSYTKSEK